MPVLTPAELWETTGPDRDPRDLPRRRPRRPRLHPADDARGDGHLPRARDPVVQAAAAALVPLPVKDRDEPRPRGGLLRVREFIMKDAYSFDRDEDGVEVSFEANRERVQEDLRPLRAGDVRRAGRERDHGRQVQRRLPRALGLAARTCSSRCENGDYAADGDIAQAVPRAPAFPDALAAPERGRDARRRRRSKALARVPRRRPRPRPRRRCRSSKDDGTLVLALVRGDDRLSEIEALRRAPRRARARRRTRRSGTPSARTAARSARSASRARSSPTRRSARGSSSPARTATAGICAVSRPAATTSRASPTSAEPKEGDTCPNCGGALHFQTAIEVGHIFNFGSFYSEPLGATFLDEDGHGEAAPRRQLRHRPRPRHGRDRRAAPRRERDRVAARGRAVRRARGRAGGSGGDRRAGGRRRCRRPATTSSSTTATCGRGRSSPTPT